MSIHNKIKEMTDKLDKLRQSSIDRGDKPYLENPLTPDHDVYGSIYAQLDEIAGTVTPETASTTSTTHPHTTHTPQDLSDLSPLDIRHHNNAYKNDSKAHLTEDDILGEFEHQLPTQPSTGELGFHLWEAVAYDIALDISPPDQIAQAYGISQQALNELQSNPYFIKLLSSKRKEIEEVGDNAETTLRFRMVTNMAMAEFIRRLTSKNTADKDFHNLFRTSLEMAKLIPLPPKDQAAQQTTIQAGSGVTFNLIGVPGLEHLSPQTATQQTQTTLAQPQPQIIDAEYQTVDNQTLEEL